MWELPRVPRRRFRLPVLLPTCLAVLVGAILAGAWRGGTDPAAVLLPTLGHTATALADGRVLVVGGADEDGSGRASAELFDPSANVWRTTSRPAVARRNHAAVRLPDGRVLVAGGDGAAASSAEIYDPLTARWRAAANPARPAGDPDSALLSDGTVLVVSSGAAQLYDASANRWRPAATPDAGGAGSALLGLADGRALLVGLSGDSRVQAYDPAADRWTLLPPPPSPIGPPAEVLADGRVLVGSGGSESAVSQEPLLLDPSTGAWSASGKMTLNRRGFTAARLADGRLIAVGGGVQAGAPARGMVLATAERYDPAAGRWTPSSSMAMPRVGHTATALPDGRILVVGGGVRPGVPAELYDPATDRWTAVSP